MQRYVVRDGRRIAVETLETGVAPRRRRADPFVKVPLGWATKAAKATKTNKAMVWIWLQHRSWKAKSSTFRLSTGRSAGLAPLSTLATIVAACRHIAARLGP
jgi:hypothetical protein